MNDNPNNKKSLYAIKLDIIKVIPNKDMDLKDIDTIELLDLKDEEFFKKVNVETAGALLTNLNEDTFSSRELYKNLKDIMQELVTALNSEDEDTGDKDDDDDDDDDGNNDNPDIIPKPERTTDEQIDGPEDMIKKIL